MKEQRKKLQMRRTVMIIFILGLIGSIMPLLLFIPIDLKVGINIAKAIMSVTIVMCILSFVSGHLLNYFHYFDR